MQKTSKKFQLITASTLDDLMDLFFENLKGENTHLKKQIVVFATSFLKSQVFLKGAQQFSSFGLFQVFYLEELTFFLKNLFQKRDKKG